MAAPPRCTNPCISMMTPARSLLGIARAGMQWTAAQAGEAIRRVVAPDARMTPVAPSEQTPSGESGGGFVTEMEMRPVLREFARTRWIAPHPTETWVMLDEQRMHSRIADLVIVRLDIATLTDRKNGGWLRPLRLTELRVIAGLRADRPTGLDAVARKAGLEPANVLRVLRSLGADGFTVREGTGYRRLAPARALAQRVVSFEAKRSEPRRALSQARAHRPWADETYVAFDERFAERFTSLAEQYERAGVGLIEIRPDTAMMQLLSRPRRRSNRLEAALMGEQALTRMLGLPAGDRPETRLPHGPLLSGESNPIIEGAHSTWVERLRRSLID
jgi:hypothetical protein